MTAQTGAISLADVRCGIDHVCVNRKGNPLRGKQTCWIEASAIAEREEQKRAAFIERFWSRVDNRGPDECWPWLGRLNKYGYGRVHVTAQEERGAHKVAYLLLVGPVPEGMQLDHQCHKADECLGGVTCPHRRCVNPAHIKPATLRENSLRGCSPWARNAAKTHCPQGHPYDGVNTYIPKPGIRVCRACRREYDLRRYYGLKAIAS